MQLQHFDNSARHINDRDCMKSFVVASNARKIITKTEMLMGAHLMSAALFRYGNFKIFLYDRDPQLLEAARLIARNSNSGRLFQKFTMTAGDYESFHENALTCFDKLLPHAKAFDEQHPYPVSVENLVLIGTNFLRSENSAHNGLNEFGTPSINYINPFIAMNAACEVSAELLKTICRDTYEGQKYNNAMDGINRYTATIHSKFPVGLSLRDSTNVQRREVLSNMRSLLGIVREQAIAVTENKLDPALEAAVVKGLSVVERYLEPFDLPIPQSSFAVEEGERFDFNVLPYPERTDDVKDLFGAKAPKPDIYS